MVTGQNNQPQRERRQPVIRLSQLSREREIVKIPVPKKSRLKRIYLPLGFSHKLCISLRKFKTNKARRSKKRRQLIFPIFLLSVKEIAIAIEHKKKSAKSTGRKVATQRARFPLLLRKAIVPLILIVMGVSGAVYFGIDLKKPKALEPISTNSVPTPAIVKPPPPPTPVSLRQSEPTKMRITRLNIITDLISVGRNPDNTMEVPKRPDIAGWYSHAPTPGELGPAVIVGHVDSPKGPAIFWRLRELQPGDIVEVDRADGKTIKFKIDQVKQFEQNNFPTQEVYGDINHAGIRLITCGGVFDRQTRHYSHNTVVFGTLVI